MGEKDVVGLRLRQVDLREESIGGKGGGLMEMGVSRFEMNEIRGEKKGLIDMGEEQESIP